MDWQAQADFLQAWPELHSLLAAYIAIEESDQLAALAAFKAENKPDTIQLAINQLQQLISANHQAWLQAAKLAGQDNIDSAWLAELLENLQKETR